MALIVLNASANSLASGLHVERNAQRTTERSIMDAIRLALAGAVLVAAFAAAPVIGADPAPSSAAAARYERERAACLSGQSAQDRETCLREAGAALQAARQGRAEDPPSEVERNRLLRCEVHPTAADREECVRRMTQGTVRGSIEGGGVVRELITREPAQ
jgi:hypothetical protein